MLLDVVTEVYGYLEGRKVLLAGLVTYTLFVLTMEIITHIPSPENYHVSWSTVQDPNAYNYLFNNIYLVWFSVVVCALSANTLNMIALSKWKILVRGKYFWMRSVTTSLVAAIIFSVLSNIFAFGLFLHGVEFFYLVKLTLISIPAKLLTLIVFAYTATFLCDFLKHKEHIDVYDNHLNYNPFSSQ